MATPKKRSKKKAKMAPSNSSRSKRLVSPFRRSNFSRIQLLVFILIFAAIGGYIILHSSAVSSCTTTVGSVSAAQTAVDSAAGGSTICMAAGSYGSINFSATHTSNVTFQPDPALDPNGAGKVTFTGINITGSYVTVHNFYVNGGVYFGYPAHHDTVDHSNVNNPNGIGVTVDGQVLSQTVPGVHDITISGNKIHDDCNSGTIPMCEADGINMNGWGNITITGNELYGLVQVQPTEGAHTDIIQSYNANNSQSSGLTFSNNYMHDNNTEGFFIKDGPAANITFNDNLCLRDPSSAHEMDVYDITNFVMRNNTCWNNIGIVLETTFNTGTMAFDHNVIDMANNLGTWNITKSYNIYGEQGFTAPFSSLSTGESVNASPAFTNTATDDYRLASNPNGIGVDWRPADQTYGPTNISGGNPAPTVSLSASPSSISSGGSSTLTWNSANATSCTASGAWSGSKATSGSQSTGALSSTSTYNLACTGAGGSTSASTTVTVTGGGSDTTPPSVPTGLGVSSKTQTSISIAWQASTDNVGVAGYHLYNGANLLASTTNLNYTFSGLTCNTTYSNLGLQAYDAAGNTSSLAQAIVDPTTTNTCTTKPGDLNGDNTVNILDLSILLSNYATTNSVADINKDGTVNILDLSILLSNYGT
jgi:hypothetical protein